MREMTKRGIETHLGHKLKGFEADKVITEGGEFAADLILFMPGMTGNQWFDNTELPRSAGRHDPGRSSTARSPAGTRSTWPATRAVSPARTGCPSRPTWPTCRPAAAVANLMDAFQGKAASHTFKAELVCIVDTRSSGMLVARTANRNLVLPSFIGFHWAKRLFEWNYLRQYR